MLRLIDNNKGVRAAQQQLEEDLGNQLPSQGKRWLTFRPTSTELNVLSHGDGRLYFGSRALPDEQKFWNAFGILEASRPKQEIIVEINFGFAGARTAGFFARDGERRFLLHSGRIGGGRKGVSQAAFLAWLKPELVAVEDDSGLATHGIVVAELDSDRLSDRIESFVRTVSSFKKAVADGRLDDPSYQKKADQWRDYLKEFSGRKLGSASYDVDYISYHGDVVDALRRWREERDEERLTVTNSPKIDLLVHKDGRLLEIYEVKTGIARQTLYTAIGQLAVHAAGRDRVARFIVLPEGQDLPEDIDQALRKLSIGKLAFRIEKDDAVSIVDFAKKNSVATMMNEHPDVEGLT